ncbi:hypothetical protein YSA_07659 [Pseudomonas putida ND6]|uniref:Uncharacterized protein n=1 Tax=Pseudomonas putida ND6 TaxID=231023 RepID=I3UZI9_PSEPU|nr:hypothetical protein YSA_07659 [Pseudomonas putida ND6]
MLVFAFYLNGATGIVVVFSPPAKQNGKITLPSVAVIANLT